MFRVAEGFGHVVAATLTLPSSAKHIKQEWPLLRVALKLGSAGVLRSAAAQPFKPWERGRSFEPMHLTELEFQETDPASLRSGIRRES